MKIVSTSYSNSVQFTDPVAWLQRISFYTGILETLAGKYRMESIEQVHCRTVLEKNGVTYHFLDFEKPVLYFPWRLHRYVKKLGPDIVFVNGLIFPLQVIQLRLTLGRTVKIILLHRGEKPFTGVKSLLQRLADNCIDAYLFTSAGFAEAWTRFGNIGSRHKIHEVIQASSVFYPQEKAPARAMTGVTGAPVFLWVGRLDANKDPMTVVKSFIGFLQYKPAAKLYMIYQSTELLDDMKELIETRPGAATAITCVGKIPHASLLHWYNAADFMISGSHHEGGGIAVCEAMSCGCIPVLTDIPSFRKITGPGNCGLLYEPGNTTSLLQTLLQTTVLDMEKERTRTLQQFRNELSFEAIAKKIEQVITTLQR